MARRWSPEEDELMVKLRMQGLTAREIACRLKDRTEDSVRVRLASKAKVRVRWTKEEEEKLLELKAAYNSNRKIAYELGRTTRAVEAKLKELMG
jgi:DNA-binding NarL/FixJ family response regulator